MCCVLFRACRVLFVTLVYAVGCLFLCVMCLLCVACYCFVLLRSARCLYVLLYVVCCPLIVVSCMFVARYSLCAF